MDDIVINGPFIHTVSYLENYSIRMGPDINKIRIVIKDQNLKLYKFISFKVRQTLKKFPWNTVMVYAEGNSYREMLPFKGSPSQVYEFMEYRIRIPVTITDTFILNFFYNSNSYLILDITDLKFGPLITDPDLFDLPVEVRLSAEGPGEVSPFPGSIPSYEGEIVEIKARAYNNCMVDCIEFNGIVLDENGNRYPPVKYGNTLQTIRPIKVRASFINWGAIHVIFKERNI